MESVVDQIIWCNSDIRVANCLIFHHAAYEAGCKTVSDILNDIKSFIPFNQYVTKWGNTLTWLEYAQIVNAIPRSWVKLLEQKGNQNYVYPYDQLYSVKNVTGVIYRTLTANEGILQTVYHKWEQVVPELKWEEYCRAFKDLGCVTVATKLRDFQYRMLLRKTFSNNMLHKRKIKASANCDNCDELDSIVHMLYYCTRISNFGNKCDNGLRKLRRQ